MLLTEGQKRGAKPKTDFGLDTWSIGNVLQMLFQQDHAPLLGADRNHQVALARREAFSFGTPSSTHIRKPETFGHPEEFALDPLPAPAYVWHLDLPPRENRACRLPDDM